MSPCPFAGGLALQVAGSYVVTAARGFDYCDFGGIRFAIMSKEITAAIVRGILFGVAGISTLALLPLVVRDHLQGGPVAYGALMAGFGSGALLAGLISGHLRQMLPEETLLKLACIACGACSLSLALTSSLLVAAAALMVGGAGWVIGWSGSNISVQWASPRWIVGRTIALYYALTNDGIALGSWLWGAMAQGYSLGSALEASFGALLLVAALGFFLPIHERAEADLGPSESDDIPIAALDLEPRSGPITIRIEYVIPCRNLEGFLGLMRERRRAQSRIGARGWTLLRSLQDTSRWTETFRTATWADYLRLNHHLSADDRDLNERIVCLHAGALPPSIDLWIERPTVPVRKSVPLRPLISQP